MNSPNRLSDKALNNLGWVRGLALRLARDAHVADDVVQEAYLLARLQPPREAQRLGPWLARVTRTLVRKERRSARSRQTRERIARANAPEASSVEPSEILERAERQRAVAEAVLGLKEPYASTVLHHYLDGLSIAEVAERTGCEPATVRKRLERARALLRERLDEEFGCETQNWALGLVLPLAHLRETAVATGATGTGTLALMGSGWMAAKLIGLVGLALASGLFLLSQMDGEQPPQDVERVASSVGGEVRQAQELPVLEDDSERLAVLPLSEVLVPAISPPLATVLAPDDLEQGVLLLVRGLDPDGNPVTSGRVDCFWGEAQRVGNPSAQHHIGSEIQGAVTRVLLPADAGSVRVCVSSANYPPCPGVDLDRLHEDADGGILTGQVVHEVDVSLVSPAAGLFVFGDIFVDGRPLCPPGLRVWLNGPGPAWINTVTSRYRYGPLRIQTGKLMVTSDFSLPTYFELDKPINGDQRIDLELLSGRELLVRAVDAATGAPAVGREVMLTVHNPVRTTLFRTHSHFHSQSARVDARGSCHFFGVPIEGSVILTQRLADGVGQRVLKAIQMDPSMPQVVECEVRLGSSEVVKTRVFGTLPVGAGAGVQAPRRIKATNHSGGGGTTTAAVDARGHWSLELDSYRLWGLRAESEGQRRSEEKLIELKGERELGPLQLDWQGGLPFTLRLVDVPQTGEIQIDCTEHGAGVSHFRRIEVTGEDLEHKLQLSGPATVVLTIIPRGGDSELGLRRTIEIDPRTRRERVVDLESSLGVTLDIRINEEYPPGEGVLMLIRPGEDPSTAQRVAFVLNEGRAIDPQRVLEGKWLYFLRHDQFPGLLLGWLDVPKTPAGPMTIHWEGALHPTLELGQGIEGEALDGHNISDFLSMESFTLPWSADQLAHDELWMPKHLTYSLMER